MLSFHDYFDMSYKNFYGYIAMHTRLSLFKFVVKKWCCLPYWKKKEIEKEKKEGRKTTQRKWIVLDSRFCKEDMWFYFALTIGLHD